MPYNTPKFDLRKIWTVSRYKDEITQRKTEFLNIFKYCELTKSLSLVKSEKKIAIKWNEKGDFLSKYKYSKSTFAKSNCSYPMIKK